MSAERGHDFDAIRANYPLLEQVQAVVPLKFHAGEWKGLCPFHAEKSPSFSVVPDKEFYHCFGCGAHGDVIDFVSAVQGVSAKEAISILTQGGVAIMSDQQRVERDRERERRRREEEKAQIAVADNSRRRWDEAPPASPDHPYLVRKGIANIAERYHVVRAEGRNLLLPVYDQNGEIMAVQTIPPEAGGKKLFPTGAATSGGGRIWASCWDA